jgi:GNAT superfamily N-acetyltransferase
MDARIVRTARPDDYDWIIAVVDEWWGRPIAGNLSRLFLDHFHATSFVTEVDGTPVAFLVGFVSPSQPHVGYIHFVGVHPAHRGGGTARDLYERFFRLAAGAGCTEVHAVTGAVNHVSIAFHQRMGFTASDPVEGYDGPGTSLVTFSRPVSPTT